MRSLRLGRLRWAMAAIAVALLVPLALLVNRARASLRIEQAVERSTVAARVFDEMERELTRIVQREEERPYAHYRALFLPEGAADNALSCSPLLAPPTEPFTLGYFQVEPDGQVTSPHQPTNPDLASALGCALPDTRSDTKPAADTVAGSELGRLVRKVWQAPGEVVPTPTPEPTPVVTALAEQVPGSTWNLVDKEKSYELKKGDRSKQAETLDKLNVGAQARNARNARVDKTEQAQVDNFVAVSELEGQARDVTDDLAGAERDDRRDDDQAYGAAPQRAAPQGASTPQAATYQAGRSIFGRRGNDASPDAASPDLARPVQASDGPASPGPAAASQPAAVDVRLEPLVGRRIDARHMALYRTVTIGTEAFRQGLAIDLDALHGWLAAKVTAAGLDPSSLGRVDPLTPPATAGTSLFRHRFAEPFGLLASEFDSGPYADGARSANFVNALGLLLLLAATAGLAFLYRMVATEVRFAERRQNFVAAVSHELKTPLTAIRMYGEMLRDGVVPTDAKRQHYYGVITAETERLSRLVDNVLELGRLERRARTVDLVAGDVGEVVAEVVAILKPHADQEGFRLEVASDAAGNPPTVALFDRDALKQVLFNLVDNAIKYGRGATTKQITIRYRSLSSGVEIAVADSGPGVARHHLRSVFEPFYRGESELTRRTQGTGIGLSLVKGLVERMGGAVRGTNRPEGGFEVTVALRATA